MPCSLLEYEFRVHLKHEKKKTQVTSEQKAMFKRITAMQNINLPGSQERTEMARGGFCVRTESNA